MIDFAVPLVFSRVLVGSLYLGFSRKPIDLAVAHAPELDHRHQRAMVVVGIAGRWGWPPCSRGP